MHTYQYYYYVPTKKFTRTEILHLLISFIILTVAFSFAFSDFFRFRNLQSLIHIFPIAILSVGTGFFLHELMHKLTAQKYGCWSEYRMFPIGLLIALLVSIAGVVFAAPGAVYIAGAVNNEKNGRIALAGPLTNIIIGLLVLPMTFIATGYLGAVTKVVYLVNVFLGLFNLLPIPPLDGYKIVAWNLGIYAGVITLGGVLFIIPHILP